MSYVEKIISADEKILTITTLHWIYIVEGALWLLFCLTLGIMADHYIFLHNNNQEGSQVAIDFWSFYPQGWEIPVILVLATIGLIGFLFMFLMYISVEVGLTNKRIVYKKGLIRIQVQQVDLVDMRSESIDHGWLGWLFGYGRLRLDCRFLEDVNLPALVKPYDLVKAIHIARLLRPDIESEQKEMGLRINDLKSRAA